VEIEIHLLIGSLVILSLAIVLMAASHREELTGPGSLFAKQNKFFKKERRAFPRYQTFLKARYKTPLEDGISWIKDISRGGARVFLNNLDLGTIVSLEVELPYNRRPIFMQGNVVWKRGTDSGVRFGAAEQDDLTRILEFIGHKERLRMATV